jgi:hypothetical protein
MELVAVALGISILVVLILLLSCWNSCQQPSYEYEEEYMPRTRKGPRGSRGPREPRGCNKRDGFVPAGVPVKNSNVNVSGYNQFFSTDGSGRSNLQQMKQYNDVINSDHLDGDYNEVIQQMSIEPEVAMSHQAYSNDVGRSTSGASSHVLRSDRNDINPRIGLRTIDYHSVYASKDARTDSSESPDQMPSKTSYRL